MKTSEQVDKVSAAFVKAQASVTGAKKDKTNPHFKSKYADLMACFEACKDALAENGLAVLQGSVPDEAGVTIETRLVHESGQWMQDEGLHVPAAKLDPQGFGSALTYARRYSLCAMVGIAPEDDDGNAAAKAVSEQKASAITPGAGLWESLPPDAQESLQALADKATGYLNTGQVENAVITLEEAGLNADEKTAIWTRFTSAHRSAMKKYTESLKQRKAA